MGIDVEALTDAMFAAAEAGDWAAFRAGFADEGVLYQNVGTTQPIDEAIPSLMAMFTDGTTLRYENVRRIVADLAVTEFHDAVFTKPDGREVRLDIVVCLQFNDDGLITRSDEYLDSAAAAALFR